jgi:hypothetical protein
VLLLFLSSLFSLSYYSSSLWTERERQREREKEREREREREREKEREKESTHTHHLLSIAASCLLHS